MSIVLNPGRDAAGWRSEFLATFALAWPLALANLAQMLVHAIDIIFIARLGAEALAAASLAIAIFSLVLWSLTGMAGMVAALIAAELGRRSHAVREVRRSVRMGLWLAMACGLAAMIPMAFAERILLATGQQPELAEPAGRFLWILMWCNVPMLLSMVLRNFVSALGRPIFATMITVSAVAVSGVANYALVLGNLGMPRLELEGAALASLITSLYILACYVAAISRDRRLRRYCIFGNWWRPEWHRLRELVRTGLPVTFTILAEAGLFNGATFMMGLIGAQQLAAYTIALQLAALAFQVPFGVGQAATIRVGYFYGARDQTGIARAGWCALIIGTGFMVLTAGVMLLAPGLIMRIYVDPADPANLVLVGFILVYLRIAAAFALFDGAQAVASGVLRGLQDTRVPMLIALFGYWLPGLGTAVWLGFFTPLAGIGIWLGLACGLVVVAGLLTWRWLRRGRLGLLPV